jgi:hypothetical protein
MATPRKAALPERTTIAPVPTASVAHVQQPTSTAAGDAEKGSSVQVVVRCRPPSEKEKATNDTVVVGVYPQLNEIRVVNKKAAASVSSVGGATNTASATSKTDTKVREQLLIAPDNSFAATN